MSRKNRRNKNESKHRPKPKVRNASVNATIDVATRLFREGRMQEAETACRQVLAAQPKNPNVLNSLAQIVCRAGRPDEAVELIHRALKFRSEPEYYNNLGIAQRALGDMGGALSSFERAIGIKPTSTEALANLAELKTYSTKDSNVIAMERLVESKSTALNGKIRLHFALAKIYDDLGDFDTAFSHLSSGSQIKRKSFDYDVAHEELLVDRLISVFSKRFLRSFDKDAARRGSWFESLARVRRPTPKPPPARSIFIVGMPRSGTTLVEQIISSHSQVYGAGEHNYFKDMVALSLGHAATSDKKFPDVVTDVSRERLHELGESYLRAISAHDHDSLRIADKTPMNFLFVGLIWMLWPTAKVLHCVRDPAATCFSCYSKLFAGDQKFAYDLNELGRYYRSYGRLMRHWHAVLPDFVLDVRYEDIVSGLETQIRRILEFCELPWEQNCLDFHDNKRPVLTASALQVRQPIYGSAVSHWRHYEKHLEPLFRALGHS